MNVQIPSEGIATDSPFTAAASIVVASQRKRKVMPPVIAASMQVEKKTH